MVNKGVNIYIGATSLRTCLGNKTETVTAMYNNESGLRYNDSFSMYVGAADVKLVEGYTRFESFLIEQLYNVLEGSLISLSDEQVQLIVSTTKGNVDLLAEADDEISSRTFLYTSVKHVADHFNCVNNPIVISNACISGVSAFVVARDLLVSGKCKHVVVAGCDVLSEFITTGFASFKSISPLPCRPYDAERDGLTLGEAAGAVVLTTNIELASIPTVCLTGGAISNDANHISGPSRTGDGLYYAISNAMKEAGINASDIGFINAHGTATRYNDDMESKAISWAGLCDKPLNSLKGHIGHTLGASGVIESILCVEQIRNGSICGTFGFVSSDTTNALKVSANTQIISYPSCIKTASGFGGCNAAIALQMKPIEETTIHSEGMRDVCVAAEYTLPQSEQPFAEYIRSEFKQFGQSDMKFYKMSDMSKGLYVAVERLLAMNGWEDIAPTRRAIILSNKSASLDADVLHQQIINKRLPEGASPAVFVYTLANVAAGEMCIRHRIQGDNTFFIEDENLGIAEGYARRLIEKDHADAVICGWCEYLKGNWNISIKLLKNI